MRYLAKTILLALWVALGFHNAADAGPTLRQIGSAEAVCNNGERANYSIVDRNSKKWFILLEGGGVVGNEDEYLDRVKNFPYAVKPLTDTGLHDAAIVKHFDELGYNTVVIHYCSSDLFQGNHTHSIGGKTVSFKGRKIVEGVIKDLSPRLREAESVVVSGYSAGSIGLGFNADLWSKLPNVKVISDSFWFDQAMLNFYANKYPKMRPDRIAFIYKNLPQGCSNVGRCFPSRPLFERHDINKVFIIWNLGYVYQNPVGRSELMAAIPEDLRFYGAGFSVDSTITKLNTISSGGHVMTVKDSSYSQPQDGVVLKDLIENWLNGAEPSMHIGY